MEPEEIRSSLAEEPVQAQQQSDIQASPEPEKKVDPFIEALNTKKVFFVDDLKSSSIYCGQENETTPALTSRLNKEMKTLTRGLPCDKSYSGFVAFDSGDMAYMTAAIAGSEGTPYAHGLYFFDVLCGSTFPESPPQFTLKTNGGGEAYFGPNLYNSGYVCLSIINTWSGDPEEMWSPDKNLLQVLLSIQALVMDNHIIQKEPGWESYEVDHPDNVVYQLMVKYINIRFAMIENLKNPPFGFAEIVDLYFRHKRDYILAEINQWLVQSKTQVLDGQESGMSSGANPNVYAKMQAEGVHKALSSIVRELVEVLEARYGKSDVELDLYIENPAAVAEVKSEAVEEENQALAVAVAVESIPPEVDINAGGEELNQMIEQEFAVDEETYPEPQLQHESVPILFREPSSSDPEAPDSTHAYFQHLGNQRLQLVELSEGHFSDYAYDQSNIDESGLSRINKEIKALTRSLPCEPEGSVFVAINSSNLSMIKVLISGVEGSPYEHGLFLFDIKLPQNYPNSPPQMTIKTTGNGTLRFNPNLYNSGYVCLSIINTWDGNPEEMWNPTYSTLMQVFLSIQALVMNSDVLQKEPGWEHLTTDSHDNMQYTSIVMHGNIKYAMTEMLKNPPPEFREIVMKHFAIKKEKILETVEAWKEIASKVALPFDNPIVTDHNYPTVDLFSNGIANCFETAIAELKEELNKLPSI